MVHTQTQIYIQTYTHAHPSNHTQIHIHANAYTHYAVLPTVKQTDARPPEAEAHDSHTGAVPEGGMRGPV